MFGQLVKRKKTVNGVAVNVNPYDILESLNKKRFDYDIYLAKANAIREFNSKISNPSAVSTWFGVKVPKEQAMPERPTAYVGDTFVGPAATASQGGYGAASSGEYKNSALYKPFGALGYGSEKNYGISLEPSKIKKRVMLVTVFPEINVDNSAL